MKPLFLFFSFLFSLQLHAQDCPPSNVYLHDQKDVDDFLTDYPNCRIIKGDLTIRNLGTNQEINDLSGLKNIEIIEGDLDLRNITIPTSLDLSSLLQVIGGVYFHSIENIDLQTLSLLNLIGSNFYISSSEFDNGLEFPSLETINGSILLSVIEMTTFSAFQNLQSIGGSITIEHISGTNQLSGFDNLLHVNNLTFSDNFDTEIIDAFSNIKSVKDLKIDYQGKLKYISSFDQLTDLEDLKITSNLKLVEISGFDSIVTLQNLIIENSPLLEAINGFSQLDTIHDDIDLLDTSVEEINGFNNLTFIGNLNFNNNSKLKSIDFFESLAVIRDHLLIYSNNSLIEIVNMPLHSVGGSIRVFSHEKLQDISGLDSFNANLLGTSPSFSSYQLALSSNNSLAICNYESVCRALELPLSILIQDNAVGCNSPEEIDCSIISANENISFINPIVYPNPTQGQVYTISTKRINLIEVFDMSGRKIISFNNFPINMSQLESGLYYLKMSNENSISYSNVVKN